MAIVPPRHNRYYDALKGKRGPNQFLDDLPAQRNLPACCSINLTEVYAGAATKPQ